MRWLATLAVVVVSGLMSPTAASGYTFGDWAYANGYSLNADMPDEVDAAGSSPAINSLVGTGDFNWTSTPTRELYLYNNQISSIASGAFSGLTNLTGLSLGNNNISSIESGDFSGLTSLTRLGLNFNQLSSIESGDFSGLANLTSLNLADNQLSSIETGDFSGPTNLEKLGLDDNQLSSIESGAFDGLTSLEELHLRRNQISSIESGDFDGLANLTRLYLGGNQISSIESGGFIGLTNLTRLYLNSNQLSSIESGTFSELTNLDRLELGSNQITSIESSTFIGLTNLTRLYLNSNQLSSIASGTFSELTNLDRLELGSNQITSIESSTFSGPTNLTELYLDQNQISSIESGAFSGLTNLRYLNLENNTALTELNLAEADFTSLTTFSVKDNVNITSVSLKNTVVNQTSLTTLLDGGDGEGTYRTGIGELDGITEMDLSGINFGNITDLAPLYVMDDLTDLWLVDTVNLGASDLDVLLNNLATIEGTSTEGILHMTQANFDDFNSTGGDFLTTWDDEDGHHVQFVVVVPGDFDGDGTCDGADFLAWQRGESPNPLSSLDLAEWQAEFGVPVSGDFDDDGDVDGNDFLAWQLNDGSQSSLADWQAAFGNSSLAATATIPEPTTLMLMMLGLTSLCFYRRRR